MKLRLNKRGKIFVRILLIVILLIGLFLIYWFRNPFVKEYKIEAGTKIELNDLLKDTSARSPQLLTTIDKNIMNKAGEHIIQVKGNDRTFDIKIIVQDTIVPIVSVQTYHYFIGDKFDANQFIKEVKDYTTVTAVLNEEIDLTKNGNYEVNVSFTDEGNNKVNHKANLIVEKDIEAPVIEVDETIMVNKGESVLYKQLITVTDNRDGKMTNYQLDNSSVNLSRVGIYPLIVTATDENNNTSTKTINVQVNLKDKNEAKSEAKIYAKEILNKIIKKSMTKQEKIKAVYNFVNGYYKYEAVHEGAINDYYVDALNGFATKKGDCYVVNAMARFLLEELGFDTYGLVLKGTDMDHISFMANSGDGWYHYCAFRKKSGIVIYKWTDEQMIKHYSFAGITAIPDSLPDTPLS